MILVLQIAAGILLALLLWNYFWITVAGVLAFALICRAVLWVIDYLDELHEAQRLLQRLAQPAPQPRKSTFGQDDEPDVVATGSEDHRPSP